MPVATLYRHTQRATTILLALGITVGGTLALAAGLALLAREGQVLPIVLVPTIVVALLVVVAYCFSSLTVEVTADALSLRFGPGWIRKSWPLADVLAARAVRNHWSWGWGVRWTPRGWLYNVAGLDAVEVELASGKRIRVGTDEPRELEAAIRRALGGERRS